MEQFRGLTKETEVRPDNIEQPIFWPEHGHAPTPEPTAELQLVALREELAELKPAQLGGDTSPPVVIEATPHKADTPQGKLQEKNMKKQRKERKEKQPKSYREKMLVISDLQLLKEANGEGIGALMAYMEDQAETFTHVVLNGDIIDFEQQSSFKADNEKGDQTTIDEQIAGRWFIDFVNEKFPQAQKVFMKGNHEQRYDNLFMENTNGVKQYLVPFQEIFGLQDWEVMDYGNGNSYDWHGRKIRHGRKGGAKQNIPKLESEETWRPVTVGHAVTNRMWEVVDADGNSHVSFVHAGFSKVAKYDKTGNKTPSNGFGVYYHDNIDGQDMENAYQVIFPANNSRFISPEGELYDGEGFNLREEIGLDPKPKRGKGRPKKRASK